MVSESNFHLLYYDYLCIDYMIEVSSILCSSMLGEAYIFENCKLCYITYGWYAVTGVTDSWSFVDGINWWLMDDPKKRPASQLDIALRI